MFKDQLPPVFPISDALFQQCCKYLDTDIDWEQAVSDYEFKTKLSEIARDILRKAGSEEETLENLQNVAKDLVRKTDRNTLDFFNIYVKKTDVVMEMSCICFSLLVFWHS